MEINAVAILYACIVVFIVIYFVGVFFIRARWRLITNIRNEVMIENFSLYRDLPPAKKMFWCLTCWSTSDFIKKIK